MRINAAYFEITNLCNLNCSSCYNRSGLNQARFELSMAQIAHIIETLAQNFGTSDFSFAGGEPLLHAQIDDLFAYIRQHTEFNFSFVTNGTIHHPKLLALLRDFPHRIRLQISLDGSCEAINALTRGAGAFQKSLGLLAQATALGFRPGVKMVISQKNLSDVEPFCRMVIAAGGLPTFAFINRNGNATEDWASKGLSPQQKVEVMTLLHHLNAELTPAGEEPLIILPRSTNICPLSDPTQPLSILVKNNGALHPCQLLYHDKYSFGNALTDSPARLEAGMEKIVALAQQRTRADYGCHRCLLRDNCGRGCPALATYADDTISMLAPDGDCSTRRLELLRFDLS